MKRLRTIVGVLFVVALLVVGFSGCDLIKSWLGLEEELTLTEPTDGAYLSVAKSVVFKGTYNNLDTIKLEIGDKVYDKMDILTGNSWEVKVDLSDVGIGEKEVKVLGYHKDSSSAVITTSPIKITIHNWLDAKNEDDLYKYLILEDEGYEGVPAEITDIATDGTYAYVAGYYVADTSGGYQAFVYRLDPVLGTWDKKIVFPSEDNFGNYPPVLIALGNGKVYVEYSIYGGKGIYLECLDTDLNTDYEYNTGDLNIAYGMCYKDGYIYLVGEDSTVHNAFVIKFQDNGTAFVSSASTTFDPNGAGALGYAVSVADNTDVYVGGMIVNTTTEYASLRRYDSGLTTLKEWWEGISNGDIYGMYYSSSKDRLYATGVLRVLADRETILYDIDPASINPPSDHSFSETVDSSSVEDEAGKGIIYDTDNSYTVVVGYQKATDDIANARAAICVRNSGFYSEKTFIFNEDNYGESSLDNVVKVNNGYYAVGYAKDADGYKRPLIMWVPDSYDED